MEQIIILYCLAVGVVAGFLGGLLGVGSGAVMVPALFALFSYVGWESALAIKMAIGTSLAAIVMPSIITVIAQMKRDAIYWSLVKVGTPFIVLGSLASGYIANMLTSMLVEAVIGGFLLIAALVMLFHWNHIAEPRVPGHITTASGSFLAGMFASLVGIAGGNIIVPTLMWFNIPLKKASATSCTLGLATSLAGAAGFVAAGWSSVNLPAYSLGFVNLPVMAVTSLMMVLIAPFGIALAHKLSVEAFKKLFGIFLVIVACRMLYQLIKSQMVYFNQVLDSSWALVIY